MPARTPTRKTGAAGLLSFVVAVALLWLFTPTSLGGDFAYVIVNGNSMSPLLKTDDIVLLRGANNYEVGDAVAYRHPQIGTVLHRIIATDGDRFILRGDNRDGNDSYTPTRDDVIGREWVILPNGGRVVRELQRPRNLVLLVGATLLLALAGGAGGRKLRRAGVEARRRVPRSTRDLSGFSPFGRQTLLLGVTLALGSGALLALFAVNGTTREDIELVPFAERGEFSYGGPVPGGVYDDNLLAAPQPLFRQLADELPLTFSYDLTSDAPDARLANVLGSYEIVAEVATDDGWTRTFPLGLSGRLVAGQFEASTALDLDAIEQELAAIAEITGVAAGRHVIRVIANVETAGELDGIPFETSYEHSVQFRLSELQLDFGDGPDALVRTENRTVSRPQTVPRTLDLPLLPVDVGYSQFPVVGTVGLALGVLLIVLVGSATLRTKRGGEAARIHAAYGALLVEVADAGVLFGNPPRDVSQFSDLVRLAAAEGLAIMHRSGPEGDQYFVATSERSWRYTVSRTDTNAIRNSLGRVVAFDRSYITTGEN